MAPTLIPTRKSSMNERVKIVECSRDAWQGLPGHIPAPQKAAYLRALIDAGFRHIDAVSFVSPAAVPQMADTENVLALLSPPDGVEIIGIVVNLKGAHRALSTYAVRTLGFPYSISPEFLRRNQNQIPRQSLQVLDSIVKLGREAELKVVAYVSMAFGNPYGDPWNLDEVAKACRQLSDLGIREISLADTVGLATPSQIADTVRRALEAGQGAEIGVHLHARSDSAPGKIRAAFHAGCRRFDAAIGGLGGCPFAQDDLVGNVPTEILVAELQSLGAKTPLLKGLPELITASIQIARNFGADPAGPALCGTEISESRP
jgi:hydroxymethylglutaryl-CoA lyase